MPSNKNLTPIIHDPQIVGKLTAQQIDAIRQNPKAGLNTGIADLDKNLLPMRPGELITVLGYTSNYKSGLMNFIAKSACRKIMESGKGDRIVAKVTWEQSVEEDTISWLAAETNIPITQIATGDLNEDEWARIQNRTIGRQVTPMWIIGHSQQESAEARHHRPRMTMTDVAQALGMIADELTDIHYQYELIVLDYLQRIRPDPGDGESRRQQMLECVNKAKDLAIQFGCPVILGVQAGRQVMERVKDAYGKLPRVEDGQETSNIEQSSDKILSVWYPIKTEGEDGEWEGLPTNQNLLVVGIMKQKLGPAPIVKALWVDPGRNIITGMKR